MAAQALTRPRGAPESESLTAEQQVMSAVIGRYQRKWRESSPSDNRRRADTTGRDALERTTSRALRG